MKKCNTCQESYPQIPSTAQYASREEYGEHAGYYFNCACNSTLYWPLNSSKQDLDKAKLILASFLALFFVACKSGSNGSATFSDYYTCDNPTPPDTTSNYQLLLESNGTEIGWFLEANAGYNWLKSPCDNYYFGIDNLGNMKKSSKLIYSDNTCSTVVAERFDYPLHYSGDIYVFQFEDKLYEYPLSGFISPLNSTMESITGYYYRNAYGPCLYDPGTENQARSVREFSGQGVYNSYSL